MATTERNLHRGFSLIEVLIAVVVLSFGLLALSSLQANLFRSGADSKARAAATALAQQQIENLRTFRQLFAGAGATSYEGIVTQAIPSTTSDGAALYGCTQVRRYRYDTATTRFVALNDVSFGIAKSGGSVSVTCSNTNVTAATLNPGTPEFKEVRVSVGWYDEADQLRQVELTDTIAAVAPIDQVFPTKDPSLARRGPEVLIRPPNQDASGNLIPEVVPIAVSDSGDTAAASSNPKPEQFVDDLSSATLFSVKTFGDTALAGEKLLKRTLDVAGVSCICSTNSPDASATNPAFQPALWNGKLQRFMPPERARDGKVTGAAIVSNQDSQVRPLCTTCCRDHVDEPQQALKVDPYRVPVGGAHAAQHYGFRKQGNNYVISDGLQSVSSQTGNEYVEACRLVRIDGVMRLVVDAKMNYMAVSPLNSSDDGFENSQFPTQYGNLVRDYIDEAVGGIPSGQTSPPVLLSAPSAAVLSTYSAVHDPAAISFTAAGQMRKLVTFGLYIDHLTADTIHAYRCAKDPSYGTAEECRGLRSADGRNALEALPFYAVNLANLGVWTSDVPSAVDVSNPQFNNQGQLAANGEGGKATSGNGSSPDDIPVSERLNISNSGLAGTVPVDPEDDADSSFTQDEQIFRKTSGTTPPSNNRFFIRINQSATVQLSKISVALTGSGCAYVAQSGGAWRCDFNTGMLPLTFTLSNFTTQQGQTINNRQVCLPSDVRIAVVANSNNGTVNETLTFNVSSLSAVDHTLTIDIVAEATSCGSISGRSLSP